MTVATPDGRIITQKVPVENNLDDLDAKVLEASKNNGSGAVVSSNNAYSGELVKVPKGDSAADALAERIGGESRVKFSNDPNGREFDTVSEL